MSIKRTIQITCPKCQHTSDFTMWQSMNTSLDPELKAGVRDRTVFLFTCPECGAQTYIDYGFLYHQMEDRIMIHYANSDENAEEIKEMLIKRGNSDEDFDSMLNNMMRDSYLIRIVRSQNELREKLAVFDAGLDDRIIEIFKVIVLVQLQHKNPDIKEPSLYFFSSDNKYYIQVISEGKPVGDIQMSEELYKKLLNDFEVGLPELRKAETEIDRQWAMDFLEAYSK